MTNGDPKIWVRIIEAHAARTYVAVILAIGVSLSLLLVAAGMWNTISNPSVTDLSPNYASAISATLGVLVGSLATYVGQSATSNPKPGEPLKDDQIVFDTKPPDEKPAP
jgi:hypothetical protein